MCDGLGAPYCSREAAHVIDEPGLHVGTFAVLIMSTDTNAKPQLDTHNAQADRVATYLEQHPKSTAKEIDAVCDTGCISKVLSAMKKELGYGIEAGTRCVPCVAGSLTRRVRTYTLLHRPSANQLKLFPSE